MFVYFILNLIFIQFQASKLVRALTGAMFFIGTMGGSQLAPIVGQKSNESVLIYPIGGDDLLKMLSG